MVAVSELVRKIRAGASIVPRLLSCFFRVRSLDRIETRGACPLCR